MELIEQKRKEQGRQLVLMALVECADLPLSEIMLQMQSDEDLLDAFVSLTPRELGLVAWEAPVSEGVSPQQSEAKAAPSKPAKKRKEAPPKAGDVAPKKKRQTTKKAPSQTDDDVPELEFNLRTEEGRIQYDGAVTKALRRIGGKVAAKDVREIVGGSPAQVRASLDRLIEQGRVVYEGKTRNTRYELAG